MSQLSPPPTSSTPLLNDKFYNVLKHVAAIGLPAVSALYYALAQIWHLSHPGQIMASISAVNVFIGALVGVSNVQYNKSDAKYVGNLEVIDTGDKKTYSLNLNSDPQDIENMTDATFKVTTVPPVSADPGNPPQLGV